MKVGIITQPLYVNYGGILQNYALQQVLIKMGHDPVTLDYMPSLSIGRYVLYVAKGMIDSQVLSSTIEETINYSSVNNQLDKYREESLSFLKSALSE